MRVVFPEPRKPVTIVTGIFMEVIGLKGGLDEANQGLVDCWEG